MLFKFGTIVFLFLALAQETVASAIVARTTGPAAVAVEVAEIGATRPVSVTKVATPKTDLAFLSGLPIKTTSPNTGFKSLAAAQDLSLLICTAENCAGSCFEVDLLIILTTTCLTTGIEFLSSAVISNTTLSFSIFVAQPGCADAIQLPTTNTCFNLELNGSPADFSDFFITF